MAVAGKAKVMSKGQRRKSEDSFVWKTEKSKITLYHKDCIAGIREGLKPRSVDVVVTSPPYNLGVKYGKYDDSVPRAEYIAWIASWGNVLKEVMDDSGSLFLNIGHKPSDPWGPFEVVSALREHFCLQNVIHWIKSIAVDPEDVGKQTGISGGFAIGHYKPINSPRFIHDLSRIHLSSDKERRCSARSDGHRCRVSGQVERFQVEYRRTGHEVPWQYMVCSVYDNTKAGS